MSPRARAVVTTGKGGYLSVVEPQARPPGSRPGARHFSGELRLPEWMPLFIALRRPAPLSYRRASILLMRPALKPGLETVWRNRDTVQIGIDPRRAIALTGMRGAAGLLRLLDGSRDRHQVLDAAGDLGMDAAIADRVLTLLAAAGALDDLPAGGYGAVPGGARARLAPELATASLAHGDADGG